jgi:hypothetical protein
MSWKIINAVLGLAAIDPEFHQELRNNPQTASHKRGFLLGQDELMMFERLNDLDLHDFSQYIFDKLDPQNSSQTKKK